MTTDEYWHTIAESYREKPQEPFEDAISRQAAIDAINRLSIHDFAYEVKTGWIVRDDAVDELRQLPSVNPQPCDDSINRQAAIDALKKYFSDDGMIETECGAYWHHVHVMDVLQGMPSVNPQPKTGCWIKVPHGFKCSKCLIVYQRPSIFCPNCGAKMVEPQESEDKCVICANNGMIDDECAYCTNHNLFKAESEEQA